MSTLTTINMENGLVKRLVNPFMESDSLKLDAGTLYTPCSSPSNLTVWHLMVTTGNLAIVSPKDGEVTVGVETVAVVTNKEHEADIDFSFGGNVFLLNEDDDEDEGVIYSSETESLYVGNSWIDFLFKNDNNPNRTGVTEELIRHNGLEPEYEAVGEFKDGKFTSFLK